MMELTDLRYFANVANSGSFSRAAELSRVTSPAISKTIKKLESELGVELFVRTTRSVTLTQSGQLLLQRCRRIFAELEGFRTDLDEIDHAVRGPLRIAAMEVFSSYTLPAALAKMVGVYPQLVPQTYEMIPQRMEALITEGQLDIGLTIGAGSDKRIAYHELGQSPGVLVCGCEHPLYRRGRVTPKRLAEYPFVVPLFYGQEHLPSLDQFPTRIERQVTATIELLQMGVQLAVLGSHLGYFPEMSIRPQLASGALRALKGFPAEPPFKLHALTRAGVRPKLGARLLIDAVRREIATF